MFSNFPGTGGYGLPLPYQTSITPSLSNGSQIHLSGTPNGSRFEVNLKTYQNDVVLHVNPRVDEGVLVLNSCQGGQWSNEERHTLYVQRGARFTLVIMATDQSFKISVNNAHICEFRQRLPMQSAHTVEVKGDLSLESVQVYPGAMSSHAMGGGFPQMNVNMPFVPPPPQASFGGSAFNTNFGFPSVTPHINPNPSFSMGGSNVPSIQSCHIRPGTRIFVRGYVNPGAKRFEINLLQGFHDHDDVAFHFNPRFDQNQIVKNHRRNGQWGAEENQPFPQYMPLVPGSPVDLQIACQHDKYTVYMNNVLIAEYSHKIPPGAVQAVQYKGDINITSIGQL